MNKNQVKGAAKVVQGEIKQAVGKLTNDAGLRGSGKIDTLKGKVQAKVGDVQDSANRAANKAMDESDRRS